jgi:hypothetical protein
MPDMHYFTQNCQYQYFMTVFKTDNMDEEHATKQSEKKWESKSASNVVMRTVGFGKTMPENSSVYAKREDYQGERGNLKEKELKGLGEDLLVPLGLMIALRRHSKDAYCWQSLIRGVLGKERQIQIPPKNWFSGIHFVLSNQSSEMEAE